MPALLLALVVAAAGGPPLLQPSASVLLLARTRSDLTAGTPAGVFELRPSAHLLFHTPALQANATYTLRSFAGLAPASLRLQHQAEAGAEWAAAPGRSIGLTTRGRFGYDDFGLQEFGARAWSLRARPAPLHSYAEWQSELSATLQPHRRLGLRVAAGYALFGALDPAEQQALPLQRGPYLSGYGAWSLTRSATLISQLWSSYSLITGERSAVVLRLSETWRHDWSRTLRTDLGLGAGVIHRTRGRDALGALLPVVHGALLRRVSLRRREGELRAELRVQPHLDTVTGRAYERAELMGAAVLPLIERAVLRVRAGGATELGVTEPGGTEMGGTQLPERLLLGDLELQYPLRDDLRVGAGALGAWQQVPLLPGAPNFQWSVYVSFVAQTSGQRSDRR